MNPLPALLLIAAGSASLVRPSRPAISAAASYTTPWADSTKLGDTTFYSRGRVVTTVQVLPDSHWAVRPPIVLGLPNGPSQLPPDSLCTLGYTGTTIPIFTATVLRDLQR